MDKAEVRAILILAGLFVNACIGLMTNWHAFFGWAVATILWGLTVEEYIKRWRKKHAKNQN